MAYEKPEGYKEVPERIADLKAAHPDARLRPVNPKRPFEVVHIDDRTFVVYVAACYRDADDQLPGIGVAWEPFPGRTPYTKDSELMNAETSAWGRAIVAALRSESKSIASAEEVRNRQADNEQQASGPRRQEEHSTVRRAPTADTGEVASQKQLGMIASLFKDKNFPDEREVRHGWVTDVVGRQFESTKELTKREASRVIEALLAVPSREEGHVNGA